MHKCLCLIFALLIISCVLFGCSIPFDYPESGCYYCEDLQMTLDFSAHKATTIENAELITRNMAIRYDRKLITYDDDENGCFNLVFEGSFKFKNGKITIKTEDGKKYEFHKEEDSVHTEQ